MAKITYDSALRELTEKKRSTKKKRLIELLTALRFDVQPNNVGHHYSYVHPGVDFFPAGTFNGGHDRNGVIKTPYIGDAIKILVEHAEEIRSYLETRT